MRRILIICMISFFPFLLFSQTTKEKQAKEKMELFKKMRDPNQNFYDVQKDAEKYFMNVDKGKGSGHKQFKRWEYHWGTRLFPYGNRMADKDAWNEVKAFKKKYVSKKSTSNPWSEMGPRTSQNITTHWAPGLGRINGIAVDPNDKNRIFVGTPAGGLWRTTDEGGTWTPLTDNMATLGVSAIAIDPNNTNTIYIGTGDRDADNTYGIGVLKSTDSGNTFNATGLTQNLADKEQVCVLRMKPGSSSIIMAGTSEGLFKSADAGSTWTQVLEGYCEDVEFQPNGSYVYAVAYENNEACFFRSTDGGDSFTKVTSGLPTGNSRALIAITAANSSYVYFLSANSSGMFGGVYRSSNYGASFSSRSTSPQIFGYYVDDGRSQAYYDLCFAVSPINSEEVHVGGIVTHKSTNGGQTWKQTSTWYYNEYTGDNPNSYEYVHCDMHALEYTADGTLYTGSDGLICKSTDGLENAVNLTEGIGHRQFYGIGISQTDEDKWIGGSQDNGTSVTIDGTWSEWLGADGGDAQVDWSNPNIVYGTIQNGNEWYKSLDGGVTKISKGGPGFGNWVVPWLMDFNNTEILYVGCQEVRKTVDGFENWVSISGFSDGANVDAVTVAPSNSDFIYTSRKVNGKMRIYRTKDGGVSWTDITGSLPNLSNTYITVHPSDANKVAISLSGYDAGEKVYTSTDAGNNWVNISNNLPNIPANCIIYHDIPENGLYVGMDVGVYYIDNTMSQWEPFMTGLPNVIVNEMEIQYFTNKIYAGTFGRGLWSTEVVKKKNLIVNFGSDNVKVFPDASIQFVDQSQDLVGTISSWNWEFPGGSPSSYSGKTPPPVTYANEGLYDVSLTVTSTSGTATKTKLKYIKIAEEYTLGQTEIVTCSGKFYSSGLYYDYENNENLTTTIKTESSNKRIVVDFISFKLEYSLDCDIDYLEIYDGTDTNAPLIGRFCSINSPGTIISTNTDGALTFKFISDQYYSTSGWEADIRCIDQ